MTTATQCRTSFESANSATIGTRIPFEGIQDPGCYICNWSGHLLRVPEDGVAPGRSPLLTIVGQDPLFVTKISDNPYMTLTKAKVVASNYDLNVNF
ncbi:MAG: hypothetical protein AABZ47_05500 [Planctomycetota bacterium]